MNYKLSDASAVSGLSVSFSQKCRSNPGVAGVTNQTRVDNLVDTTPLYFLTSFAERLIGSIRRELLDQTLFWTAADLENKLRGYQDYYNEHRCHSSLDGKTPLESCGNKIVDVSSYR